MGDKEKDMEDMSRYEKSAVGLARLHLEDIVFMLLLSRLGLIHAMVGMVN